MTRELILNNPYRTLGLLAGATAREQTGQIRRLKMYIDAEQEAPADADYGFPVLGSLHRTVDAVAEAESKLHLDGDKMAAALFWFYKGNEITDEPAFDALKSGDATTAYNIWHRLIIGTNANGQKCWRQVSPRNASAFHNFFVIELSLENGNLRNAITANIKFLESDFVKDFKALATDETYKTTKEELQLLFLRQIQAEIGTETLLNIVNKQTFAAKTDFLKFISQKFTTNISAQIEIARNVRTVNKQNAATAGENLYKNTKNDLTQLKDIFGAQDFSYSNTADKVANEMLQCSIDFFNDSQDKGLDNNYHEKAIKIVTLAQGIAVGSVVKNRIKENLQTMEEMKEQHGIKKYLDNIRTLLDSDSQEDILGEVFMIARSFGFVDNYTSRIAKAKEIIEKAKSELLSIKTIVKGDNELYMGISTRVASEIQHIIIEEVNKAQEKATSYLGRNSLRTTLQNAWEVTELIGSLDMSAEFNSHYQNNKNLLKNLCGQVAVSTPSYNFPKIPQMSFIINSSEITNTDNKPLYRKYVRYIGIKLNISVQKEQYDLKISKKYINPDGTINRNSKTSPTDYTTEDTYNINVNTKILDLSGWGNSDKCTYELGKNAIEVYVDGYMVHRKEFTIDLAPSEKLEIELKKAEDKLKEINKTTYFAHEIATEELNMTDIQEFHLFRSSSTKQKQIDEQQRKIENLEQKAADEKKRLIEQQNRIIYKLKADMQTTEY